MTPHRERVAWLAFMVIIGVIALRPPPGVSPTDDDLQFARSLIELRQRIDQRYVRGVSDEALRLSAISGMMGALDEFSAYIPADAAEAFERDMRGEYRGVGILVDRKDEETGGLIIVRALPGSPALAAGVRSGDQIVAVDGDDVTALEQSEIVRRIQGEVGTPVTLTLARTGPDGAIQRLDLTMTRADLATPVLQGWRRDEQGQDVFWVDPEAPVKVGYIHLTRFTDGSARQVADLVKALLAEGMQGLVLDLRRNPGGLLHEATELADLFLAEGAIYFKRGLNAPEERRYATAEGTLPRFPMVVLVNEGSASAAEVLAGALAENGRAVVVGTRSFGKASVQDVITLSDGSELKLTTAYYYLPSGRNIHKEPGDAEWGVEPDVPVPVNYRDPAEQGRAGQEPEFPRQPRAAVEVLLGMIVAQQQGAGPATRRDASGGESIRPLERREGSATRPATAPATRPAS